MARRVKRKWLPLLCLAMFGLVSCSQLMTSPRPHVDPGSSDAMAPIRNPSAVSVASSDRPPHRNLGSSPGNWVLAGDGFWISHPAPGPTPSAQGGLKFMIETRRNQGSKLPTPPTATSETSPSVATGTTTLSLTDGRFLYPTVMTLPDEGTWVVRVSIDGSTVTFPVVYR